MITKNSPQIDHFISLGPGSTILRKQNKKKTQVFKSYLPALTSQAASDGTGVVPPPEATNATVAESSTALVPRVEAELEERWFLWQEVTNWMIFGKDDEDEDDAIAAGGVGGWFGKEKVQYWYWIILKIKKELLLLKEPVED